jgi:hypothetical protein
MSDFKRKLNTCYRMLDGQRDQSGVKAYIPWPNEKQQTLPGFEPPKDEPPKRDCPLFEDETWTH